MHFFLGEVFVDVGGEMDRSYKLHSNYGGTSVVLLYLYHLVHCRVMMGN